MSSNTTGSILRPNESAHDVHTSDTGVNDVQNDYKFDSLFYKGGFEMRGEMELETLDYLYGPICCAISMLSTLLIAVTFLKKSMVSATTILLVAIAISRSLGDVIKYGLYVYEYFAYPNQDIIFIFNYPFCLVEFYLGIIRQISGVCAQSLVLCVAFQRVVVVRWPFQSRNVMTKGVSLIALVVCILIGGAYQIPDFYKRTHHMTLESYMDMRGVDIDKYITWYENNYYYYYYYYYYDEPSVSDNVAKTEYISEPLSTVLVVSESVTWSETATTVDGLDILTTTAMNDFQMSNGILTNLFPDVMSVLPVSVNVTVGVPKIIPSSPSPTNDQPITDELREKWYYNCYYKSNRELTKILMMINAILNIIYVFLLAVSSLLLIIFLGKRSAPSQRHESEEKLRKMRNLNIFVLSFLIVEFLRALLFIWFLLVAFLDAIGAIKLFDVFEPNVWIKLLKIRDIISTFGSLINIWVYVIASDQFREEMIKTISCGHIGRLES